MATVYSGYVSANKGFDGPEPFNGPAGWTVDKMGQTEIFKIQHNLNLAGPYKLRVTATTTTSKTIANIESMTVNDFTVSVWTLNGAPAQTDFQFIAVM